MNIFFVGFMIYEIYNIIMRVSVFGYFPLHPIGYAIFRLESWSDEHVSVSIHMYISPTN